MRFLVVSPNLKDWKNKSNISKWLEAIGKNHCVYMGYKPEDKGGQLFYNCGCGDVILVAHGSRKNKKLYFAGIVDSDAIEVTPQKDGVPWVAYARKLKGMVGKDVLDELKLDFKDAAMGDTKNPGAIYELHPERKQKDKAIGEKLKTALEKAMSMNEQNAQMENWIALLKSNYNLILTGAPGTGKTCLARQIAQKLIFGDAWVPKDEKVFLDPVKAEFEQRFKFVQFHPSYDYTDFVEGLRPKAQTDESGNIGFERNDGVFKEFCKAAREECKYKDNGEYDETSNKFVFVIDEINRGELSKIFGELFFSIDPGYRGVKGKVNTQYSNLIDPKDVFKGGFYVPENVYIIGTMNDIDRSVESFDFAMRRRFVWEEIKAWDTKDGKEVVPMLDELDQVKDGLTKDAVNHLVKLNQAIWDDEGDDGKGMGIDGLNSSYHIGGAYFLKLKNFNGNFDDLWKYHLEPLLREYLRGMPEEKAKLDTLKKAYEQAHS